MFIEKLWEENPKLVSKEIKRIFSIIEETDDNFYFFEFDKGHIVFIKLGEVTTRISVGDFDIRTSYSGDNYAQSSFSIEWMKFMKNMFGDKYLSEFIDYRNRQLDLYMAKYEKQYTNQTKEVLAKLGVEKYKNTQTI